MDNCAANFKATCKRYGVAVLSAITIAALIAYPLPLCIDCEYPNPWGHVTVRSEIPVSLWLLISPFLAGTLPIRRGWLVPVVVVALVATQPLGGVAWWSLRENEGPFILLLGFPLTAACFGVGWLIRSVGTSIRPRAV